MLNKHLKETANQGTWAWVRILPLISCAAWSLASCAPIFFLGQKGQKDKKRPLVSKATFSPFPKLPLGVGVGVLPGAYPTPVHQGVLSLAQAAEGPWEDR